MKVWVDHFSTYIYQKRGFYYFSQRVPKEVQPLHGKRRIVLALHIGSRAKMRIQPHIMDYGTSGNDQPSNSIPCFWCEFVSPCNVPVNPQ